MPHVYFVALLLFFFFADNYGLLTLAAYNSTVVLPRPNVITEHLSTKNILHCKSIGPIGTVGVLQRWPEVPE